jgi:hypothetical protein
VRENLEFYKSIGYAGVFITNHFIDGNLNMEKTRPYEERINFYFSDYEEGLKIADEIGISVFCGVEMSFEGTDFLVYGLDKEWYLAHPEIEGMKKSKLLPMLMEAGALIIQAHPFREAGYIDHIRLFPKHVHGVEIFNGGNRDEMNQMARIYADHYGLIYFSGSDNHTCAAKRSIGGMQSEKPIQCVEDFIEGVLNGEITVAPVYVNKKYQ